MFSLTHHPSPLICHPSFALISLKSLWKAGVQMAKKPNAFHYSSNGNTRRKSRSFDNNGRCTTEPWSRMNRNVILNWWSLPLRGEHCNAGWAEDAALCPSKDWCLLKKVLPRHLSGKEPLCPFCLEFEQMSRRAGPDPFTHSLEILKR